MNRRVRGEVLRLALPAAVQHALQTAVFIADRAMLGHYHTDALAAMQIAGPVRWTVFSIFTAFSAGTIAVIARHVGAGRSEEARRAAGTACGLSLLVGTLVALSSFGLPAVVALYEPTAAVADASLVYLRCSMWISPVVCCVIISTFVLQAAGDTRTPMLIAALANGCNILGNWLLIEGRLGCPELGVLGAGLASAGSMVLELIIFAWVLLSGRTRIRIAIRDMLVLRWQVLRPILVISAPALLEQLVFHSGFIMFTIIVGWLGPLAMAANQAAVSIESICFLSADAFGIAGAALVGQKLGAGRRRESEIAGDQAARSCTLILLAASIFFFLFPEPIMALFTNDQAAIAMGALALRVGVFELPFLGMANVLARSFRGAGQTRFPLLVTAIGVWGVRVPCSWLFGICFEFGLAGVWVATLLDWFLRALILAWGWQRGKLRAAELAG